LPKTTTSSQRSNEAIGRRVQQYSLKFFFSENVQEAISPRLNEIIKRERGRERERERKRKREEEDITISFNLLKLEM